MLISSGFAEIVGDAIQVPAHTRAPLYLSEGTRIFVSTLHHGKTRFPELILSTFPPELWSDLWRIELELHDAPGLIADAVSLLSQANINILVAESTSLDAGLFHAVSMIADCRHYSTSAEAVGGSKLRNQMESLYSALAVTFVDRLHFPDGENPRLRIRRLAAYYRFSQWLASGELSSPQRAHFRDGCIKLPPEMFNDLSTNEMEGMRHSMVVTDSKDRIMRVLFGVPNFGLIHIRLVFRRESKILPDIFQCIQAANFDVIRSRLRQGFYRARDMQVLGEESECSTLDLLIRSLNDNPGSDSELVESVEKYIRLKLGGAPVRVFLAEIHATEGKD